MREEISETETLFNARISRLSVKQIEACIREIGGAPVSKIGADKNTVRAALLTEYEKRKGADAVDALMDELGL